MIAGLSRYNQHMRISCLASDAVISAPHVQHRGRQDSLLPLKAFYTESAFVELFASVRDPVSAAVLPDDSLSNFLALSIYARNDYTYRCRKISTLASKLDLTTRPPFYDRSVSRRSRK